MRARARILPALAILGLAAVASARETIGIYRSWGAFRENAGRCFAISEPVEFTTGSGRPFAAVGYWPDGARGQLHVRLSRPARRGARIMLAIGGYNAVLTGSGADAWAPGRRADAEAVANMRVGSSMSVASVSGAGAFADVYRLRGAASAIDAAALACLPSR